MRLIPAIVGIVEHRMAAPFWRRLVLAYERAEELATFLRRWRQRRAARALRGRFCRRPFESFELQESGSVYLCCPAWLRRRAGNLHDRGAEEIWNSPAAREIRSSILDGSFRYCNHARCPDIQAGTLPTMAEAARDPRYRDIVEKKLTVLPGIPAFINLMNDRSCNLSCPSCRTKRIQFNEGPGYEMRKRLQDRLVQALFARPSAQAFTLSVTGSGDPFASRVFREFLFALDGADFPNMRVNLQTHGVLLNDKAWAAIHKLHGRIGTVGVSIDAASEATYLVTRRGGDWRRLMKNLEMLAALRRDGRIGELILFFVVQKANYREMPDFVRLGRRLGVDSVQFSKVYNWGTWSASEIRDQCIWEPGHPQQPDFARAIVDPIFDDPLVSLGTLTRERRAAIEAVRAPLTAA